MSTSSITTLRPNVTREEALRSFSTAGLSAFYWRMRSGPLQRLADVYVPFSLYTVQYEISRNRKKHVFALDTVNGSLDVFQFPRLPEMDQVVTIATRNFLSSSLPEVQAVELLRQKILRLIFQQGFFKVGDPKIEIKRADVALHIPYWLGFYGKGVLRCRAMDAVRRRFEGAKASAFFEAWLAA